MAIQHRASRGTLLAMALPAMLVSASAAQQTHPPHFVAGPGSPIPVADGPGNIALGDVNQDHTPDVIVAGSQGISVLIGQGDGQFHAAHDAPINVPDPAGDMILRDLNGDGRLDLAITNHDSYGVMLLFGDGTGGFALAPHSPFIMKEGLRPHTHGLNAGDLNGDGTIDLVTVNCNDNDVSVAFGNGQGGFTRAAWPFAVGPSPYPAALGDVNGDHHLDIIATTTDRSRSDQALSRALTVLIGDGRGGFRTSAVPLRTAHPGFVAVGDVNGDSHGDLVATHLERSQLTVLIGDGQGGFSETSGSPFDLGHAAWHIAMIDVNRDGAADVVAAAGDGVRVMLSDGRGSFAQAPRSPIATGKGTWQLAVGDVNTDGKLDVVTSNLESDSVTVLLAQ